MATQLRPDRPYVFLSYTKPDRARVLALADRLEASGVRVWLDRRSLVGGSSWDTSIVHAIAGCAAFALVCSAASLASPNVQQELRLAWEEQRPILPLLLEPVTIPAELRYPLAGRQWVELIDRPEAVWTSDILRALEQLGLQVASQTGAGGEPVGTTSGYVPAPLTGIIGREQEVAALSALLAEARLVTLIGPGGTGKTRVALAVADRLRQRYRHGTWFVDLSPVTDPELVLATIARTLGVPEQQRPVRDSVLAFLREKQLLLILDNFEQVLAAAGSVRDLLSEVRELRVLATSRAALRLPGEHEYPLDPLPLPPEAPDLAELLENPAAALFVERARAVRPSFELNAQDAPAVAAIVRRLDGLPLAIELAAARLRLFSPQALAGRLDDRLTLLTGGSSALPARQQTLRGALQWSYDLLHPAEQQLFRRLSVFIGGSTLALADAVCNAAGDLGINPLDGISSLVEQSLLRGLQGPDGEPRYGMLETIREFAWEQLQASGEASVLQHAHADVFVRLAEQAGAMLFTPSWKTGERQLRAERHNLRAGFAWATGSEDAALALRLVSALSGWLYAYGGEPVSTGIAWAAQALALPVADAPSAGRAGTLFALGLALFAGGDFRGSIAALREAVELFRTLDHAQSLSLALSYLAINYPAASRTAAALRHESLAAAELAGSAYARGMALNLQAQHAWWRGDYPTARRLAEACLTEAEAAATPYLLWAAWKNLAYIATEQDDPEAGTFIARTAAAADAADHPPAGMLDLLVLRGVQALLAGQSSEATAAAMEGLHIASGAGIQVASVRWLIELLACVWSADGDVPERGARLLGAAARVREASAGPRLARLEGLVQQATTALQRRLGGEAFAAAFVGGHALALDRCVVEVLGQTAEPEFHRRRDV